MGLFISEVDRSANQNVRRRVWYCHLLSTLLLFSGLMVGKVMAEASQPRVVRVAEVSKVDTDRLLRLPGVLRAVQRVEMAFQHAGHLTSRPVKIGQHVEKGELLARLHHPALHPALGAAEAQVKALDEQLAQLSREHSRLEALHHRGLVATEQWEQHGTQLRQLEQARKQALAASHEARGHLAESELRAPFAGVVAALHVEPGQFITPGQVVVSLVNPAMLEVALALPTRYSTTLRHGDQAVVYAQGSERVAHGQIREIGLAAPGRATTVIVELMGENLLGWQTGQPVHVELALLTAVRLQLPLTALVDAGRGKARVFRLRGERVEALQLNSVTLQHGWVRVDGPLQAGDSVVVAGQGQLLDGEPVRVLP